MNTKDKKRLVQLVNTMARKHEVALNSQRRYLWRPDTETGRKEYDRCESAMGAFVEALNEVHDILARDQ